MYSYTMDCWNSMAKIPKEEEEDRNSAGDVSNSSGDSQSLGNANSGGEEVVSPPHPRLPARGSLPTGRAAAGDNKSRTSSRTSESSNSEDGEDDPEKPALSYIALISKAILDSPSQKLLLGDIYTSIMDKFSYYMHVADKAWRNSIRHNLSLNECFIKNGRAENGKGNYWSVHPACVEDFSKGDYRRRQARRRARRSAQPYPTSASQMPTSYAYNMGYVPMTQMCTGLGLSTRRAQLLDSASYGPSRYLAPISTQSSSSSSASYPTPRYLQSHAGPPPNVTSTQIASLCSLSAGLQNSGAFIPSSLGPSSVSLSMSNHTSYPASMMPSSANTTAQQSPLNTSEFNSSSFAKNFHHSFNANSMSSSLGLSHPQSAMASPALSGSFDTGPFHHSLCANTLQGSIGATTLQGSLGVNGLESPHGASALTSSPGSSPVTCSLNASALHGSSRDYYTYSTLNFNPNVVPISR